jgi:hypothetical protein
LFNAKNEFFVELAKTENHDDDKNNTISNVYGTQPAGTLSFGSRGGFFA